MIAVTLGGTAAAHPMAPALLQLTEHAGGRVEVRWKQPLRGPALEPVLPDSCTPEGARTLRETPQDAGVVTRWAIRCKGGLAGKRAGVSGLLSGSETALLSATLLDGAHVELVLSPESPVVTLPAHMNTLEVALGYFRLGVMHIATGADHLLFVLGLLLLVGPTRRLAWAISGFTLGHSVTLTVAALGHAPLPARVVEVGIALSVLVLAVELARTPPPESSWMRRFPLGMSCAFGLLHGFGFAAALREVGLPQTDLPLSLFSFNVGIEVGQLCFVAVAIAVGYGIRRLPFRLPSKSDRVPVYVMGSLAAFWTLQRAAVLFGSGHLW